MSDIDTNTVSMIIALKGSPQYSIDSNGIMTINTVWMLMPTNGTDGMSSMDWLSFGNQVELWAGKPGDAYKNPVVSEGSREAKTFTEDVAYKVESVSWECVSGRTHYEVSYTNVQNASVMTQVGNVSVSCNENNERTKTIRYRLDLPPNTKEASGSESGVSGNLFIDAYLIPSGTAVDWAGTSYLVESSEYTAETATRYEISITAKDMSVMMIGKPTESVDGFGQRTIEVTWRYSTESFEELTALPNAGDDAAPYINGLEDFLIQNVTIEPQGVLGYNVKISAVHTSCRFVTSTVRKSKNQGVEYSINYQSDSTNVSTFVDAVGTDMVSYLPSDDSGIQSGIDIDDTIQVSEVSVTEQSRGNYDVTLTASRGGSSSADVSTTASASGTASVFVIEPRHGGWDVMVNGSGLYEINNPPTTMFSYQLNPLEYWNSINDSGNKVGWTEQSLLDAIKNGKAIGYDRVARVYRASDGADITNKKFELAFITKLSDISRVVMQGFVYAQPTMTEPESSSGSTTQTTMRNIYFKPWIARYEAPLFISASQLSNYPTKDGRDRAFARRYIHQEVPMMEFSVTHNYKGNVSSILKRSWDTYFSKAIDYVSSSRFTSYRCTGIDTAETYDSNGAVWTSVTVTVQALMYCYWNVNYGSGGVYYVKHQS